MKAATPEQAKEFCDFMAREFHCRIVRRSDAPEFELIRGILDMVGVPDITKVMEERSFTVGPLIYLSDILSPDEVIWVVPHECQHVVQQRREGLKIVAMYALHGEARAVLEAEGYRAGAEVQFARTKMLPTLDELTQPMRHGYFLSDNDLRLARKLFEVAAATMIHGLVSTEGARAAIPWLSNHYPELLA